MEGLLHEIGLIYITNKLHHRKWFVRILFTRCKTLETHYAHLFVCKVLPLVNKNPQAHFLSSTLFVSVNQQGSDTIKIIF